MLLHPEEAGGNFAATCSTRALAATPSPVTSGTVATRRGSAGWAVPVLVKVGRLRSSDRAGPISVTVAVSHARLIVQAQSSGVRYSREHLERLITLARNQLSLLMSDPRCTQISDGAGARRRDDGYSR